VCWALRFACLAFDPSVGQDLQGRRNATLRLLLITAHLEGAGGVDGFFLICLLAGV
jgi:hypothetical protein